MPNANGAKTPRQRRPKIRVLTINGTNVTLGVAKTNVVKMVVPKDQLEGFVWDQINAFNTPILIVNNTPSS